MIKKNIVVELSEDDEVQLQKIIADIEKLKMQEQPPAFEKQKKCGKCAYHDLCFI